MNIVFKKLTTFTSVLLITATVCNAQSALSKVPFDIVAGTTKSKELESNGVCVATRKNSDSVSYCTRYSMSGNKFFVYIGPTFVAAKISFLAVAHHTLPDNWKALGLRLAGAYRYRKLVNNDGTPKKMENEAGSSVEEYLQILKTNGIQNITQKSSYNSDYEKVETISFTLGTQRYDAAFIKWVKPKWCTNCATYTDYDNGMVSIEIVEAY